MDPFCYLCFMFVFVLSVPCSLIVTYWERVELLTLLCVVFPCVLSLLGQVWNLIVWIPGPDLCSIFLEISHKCMI